MSSTLATSFLLVKSPPLAAPGHLSAGNNSRSPASVRTVRRRAAPPSYSSSSSDEIDRGGSYINRVTQSLKTLTKAAILLGAVASITAKPFQARAWPPAPVSVCKTIKEGVDNSWAEFIESGPEALDKVRYYVQEKFLGGKTDEALQVLDWMTEAQPSADEWIFFKARILRGIGRTEDARKVFEEILAKNPTSFEASFELDMLVDSCGEGEVVIRRLQEALDVMVEEDPSKETLDVMVEEDPSKETSDVAVENPAKDMLDVAVEDTAKETLDVSEVEEPAKDTLDVAVEEGQVEESRNVRLIIAQIQFLQKNVEGALASYQELINEDPSDFRPYFCRGMIYLSLDRIEEAEDQFIKYYELTQKLSDVGVCMRALC